MILIVYTTAYRLGSEMFKRVSETMESEIKQQVDNEILNSGIFSKKDLIEIFDTIKQNGKTIDEFHFIGHSGMYGPMFGTIDYPEQFSPYEWRNIIIPFSKNAKAYFHCCRSARWFAPFFAQQFNVETFGYHWYTTFTSDKYKFKIANLKSEKIYAIGCPGKKSHGIIGAIKKYTGIVKLEKMRSFIKLDFTEDRTYNNVSKLYDETFKDIKVRKDEWKWIMDHLPQNNEISILDVGCGNGSLLNELSSKVKKGIGVDVSNSIIEKAKNRNLNNSNIEFRLLEGPLLPIENQSVDLVISLLSFRYLDWDPIMNEIKRVLKPGGKVLIVDMVTVPVKWNEIHLFLYDKLKHYIQRAENPEYYKNLKKLVNSTDWKEMLKYNPIRSEHEMKWYLESRFPNKKVEKINRGLNSCILAFDSGNIDNLNQINLQYP